ncbi:MAG: MoaD/ThiS family protein [Candidatus Schekmanbacteria bacterium]|nr:MAG: MoaD/ThiS family protein [Candidatus Schekmanbacteria bacterium]
MKIRVELFANLIKYAPEGKKKFTIELNNGSTVGDLFEYLNIPEEERKIVIINGRHSQNDTVIEDGAEVVIMTPVEGG